MPLAYFITFSTYGTWLHGTDNQVPAPVSKEALPEQLLGRHQ